MEKISSESLLEKKILVEDSISEYIDIVFNIVKDNNGEYIDLSDNRDLKNILEKEGMDIVEIILSSRLNLFNPDIKLKGNKIFIFDKYGVNSEFKKTLDTSFIDTLECSLDKNIELNLTPLIETIKIVQDLIYTDDFIDSVFEKILETGGVSFLNNFFEKHLSGLDPDLKIDIFGKNRDLKSVISIINLAGAKIKKPNLFDDFKKASFHNIVKIANERGFLKLEYSKNKYSNKNVQKLLSSFKELGVKNKTILSVKNSSSDSLNEDSILDLIDLSLSNFLDKKFFSAFENNNSNSRKYLENLIFTYSSKYKKYDIKYISLLSKYKTFYLPIIKKINNGINNKIDSIELIQGKSLELQKLSEKLDILKEKKEEIYKDLGNINESGVSNYTYKDKYQINDDILVLKLNIKNIKESIESLFSSIDKEIISYSELKILEDFIKIKNKLESLVDKKKLLKKEGQEIAA